MDDLAAVGSYFERVGERWASTDGSVAAHLRRLELDGLIAEFRSDPNFGDVCRYLHRVSDVQYVHDTGYSDFKRKVRDATFGPSRGLKGTRRQVSLIVRAAMLTCGVSPAGERLVRIAGALPQ